MPLLPLLLLLLVPSAAVADKDNHSASFALNFFPDNGAIAQLILTDANATSSGAISMRAPNAMVLYHKPIHFAAGASFSTNFSFSLGPSSKAGAPGLIFFLTAPEPSYDDDDVFVSFDAVDPSDIKIQVYFAGELASFSAGPFTGTQKLHSWIEYNATSAMLISASGLNGAPGTLVSRRLDFPSRLRGGSSKEKLLFAALTSLEGANCTLFSWAFKVNNGPPYLMHSQPLDPTGFSLATPPAHRLHRGAQSNRYHWVSLLFAAAAGAALTLFVLFVWYYME